MPALCSNQTVQLTGRHGIIVDADGLVSCLQKGGAPAALLACVAFRLARRCAPGMHPAPLLLCTARVQVVTEVAKGSRGVVGCTPILKPGECFEYYSGTDVETPGLCMRGSFQMRVVDPQRPQDPPSHAFDAQIAPFCFMPAGGGA